MLTETGNGVYVDRLHGYDRLEEILHSTGCFDPQWSGGRSGSLFHEPIRRESYSQIILRLKDIRPIPPYAEIPSDLNLLSILNSPDSGPESGAQPWSAAGIQVCGNHHRARRVLISGVSHLLNDLLMGIQGNISLIRLSLGPNHPSDPVLENTEELIHSGSFMINLLLGYLAERRFKTRQTRFRHLINETSGSPAHADVDSARRRFERWINTASKYDGLAHISRNCARIFKGLILNLRRCLDGMCAEAESSAVVKARFKKIYELADSVNRMAEKLLRFAGSQAPDLQSVSISCLLNERLDAFRQRHGHIRLKKYVSRSMTAIQADSMLIAEALDQILQNAAESMPTGGCLTARAKQLTFGQACNKHSGTDTGSYVMVEIADTGIGISPDAQDSIFDPFFTTKPHGKGHGLGLSAAVGALRIHGGFIEVESKPGSGSRFKLYLP